MSAPLFLSRKEYTICTGNIQKSCIGSTESVQRKYIRQTEKCTKSVYIDKIIKREYYNIY